MRHCGKLERNVAVLKLKRGVGRHRLCRIIWDLVNLHKWQRCLELATCHLLPIWDVLLERSNSCMHMRHAASLHVISGTHEVEIQKTMRRHKQS